MANQSKLIRDIKAIAYHIQNGEGVGIKMDDLSHKLNLLVAELEDLQLRKEAETVSTKKQQFDIAIISIIPKEFEALNTVFNFRNEENNEEFDHILGLRLWKTSIKQERGDKRELSALFTMVGSAGNLPSYLETNTILKKYDIGLMILCGIAAGSKDKKSIYSAVVSDNVVYYENQKLTETGSEFRFKPIPVDDIRVKDLPHLESILNRWKGKFIDSLKSIKINKGDFNDKDWIDKDWIDNVKIETGSILSGEKLFADGNYFDHLSEVSSIGKSRVAGEMEGYGFGYACRQNSHSDWLIFRGISDYGGKEKRDEVNQKYQILAALSAATLVREYLEHIYIPKEVN